MVCLNARRESRAITAVTNSIVTAVTNQTVNAITNLTVSISTNVVYSTMTNLSPAQPVATVQPTGDNATETNAPAVALYERHGFRRWGLEPRALKLGEGRYTTDACYWLSLTGVAP